jgi:hypothetical protein
MSFLKFDEYLNNNFDEYLHRRVLKFNELDHNTNKLKSDLEKRVEDFTVIIKKSKAFLEIDVLQAIIGGNVSYVDEKQFLTAPNITTTSTDFQLLTICGKLTLLYDNLLTYTARINQLAAESHIALM